jgi:hypothetical protein
MSTVTTPRVYVFSIEDSVMKPAMIFLVALLFGVCAFAAEPDRPIGVDSNNWIQISPNLGFVVVATSEPASPKLEGSNPQLLLNKVAPEAPAAGYFMIKSQSGWRRLVVMTPADIAAAVKS